MKNFLSLLAILFLFSQSATADLYHSSYRNYVYDCDGTPLFVKIYVEDTALMSHPKHEAKIFQKFLQTDEFGSFFPIPITKKKKDKDKDKDDQEEESYWICPACETRNPESARFCTNNACPLYRSGWRDW